MSTKESEHGYNWVEYKDDYFLGQNLISLDKINVWFSVYNEKFS